MTAVILEITYSNINMNVKSVICRCGNHLNDVLSHLDGSGSVNYIDILHWMCKSSHHGFIRIVAKGFCHCIWWHIGSNDDQMTVKLHCSKFDFNLTGSCVSDYILEYGCCLLSSIFYWTGIIHPSNQLVVITIKVLGQSTLLYKHSIG